MELLELGVDVELVELDDVGIVVLVVFGKVIEVGTLVGIVGIVGIVGVVIELGVVVHGIVLFHEVELDEFHEVELVEFQEVLGFDPLEEDQLFSLEDQELLPEFELVGHPGV